MENPENCIECGNPIPEHRRNQNRRVVTCSVQCSNKRNTTSSINRTKEGEFIIAQDVFKEIAKLYVQLGKKLDELDRMMRRKK